MEKIGAKVVDLNKHRMHPIFNGSFRQRVENGIRPQTEKPEEIVQAIEHLICAEIVTVFRGFLTRLVDRASASLGERASKKSV